MYDLSVVRSLFQSDSSLTALAHTHTHTGLLPDSDPAPVVEFFTRTGITAAGGQFDCERCPRKMFVHRNRKSNLIVLLYVRRGKKAKDNTGYSQF